MSLVRVAKDASALMRLAAEEVAERAETAVAERGRFFLALAGGATPKRLYLLLADPRGPYFTRVPWDKTDIFFGDERHVHPDDPESNYGMARAALLSRVPVRPEHVHRIRAEDTNADAVAADYERELRRTFGSKPGELPRFDLVLLGLGQDGHTASLFPGSDALDATEKLVLAPYVERLRTHRITLALPVLNAARAVVFLVSGAEKAEKVAEVLEGAGSALPAARIKPSGGELTWLLDAPAAALLGGAGARPPA
ncbi:MAG TPA: 6-phosphogluconolactonase [Anaeromyxobacteraceae bacterium]|nr:6-phosphogluconolactonase [Anaeromyxobacteraceae bacterium]